MTFIDSFKIHLNDFHLNKLKSIDNFDYSETLKKVNHDLGGVSNDYLQKGLENLKRYYAVALLDPNNEHAEVIDLIPIGDGH